MLPCGKRHGIAMIGLLIADRSWLIRTRTRLTLIAKRVRDYTVIDEGRND